MTCPIVVEFEFLFYFLPEDHAIGLSTFTVMAGLGGNYLFYFTIVMTWTKKSFNEYIFLFFTLRFVKDLEYVNTYFLSGSLGYAMGAFNWGSLGKQCAMPFSEQAKAL